MMKFLKWLFIGLCALVLLGVAAVFIIPQVVDVQKYKPRVEQMVTDATGRPFSVGDDFKLSLFPWVGVSLSDLHLGNAAGFGSDDFVSIQSFDVKVKLLPLLSRDIQVKEFVVESPRIFLVKNKKGVGNWEVPAPAAPQAGTKTQTGAPVKPSGAEGGQGAGALPLAALKVDRFFISNGIVGWRDMAVGDSRELTDISLQLNDLSLDAPVGVQFSAKVDGNPVALAGQVGPVGNPPAGGDLPLDITLTLLEELSLAVKGKITGATADPAFSLRVHLSSFSPRKVLERFGKSDLLPVKDADTFNKFSFKGDVSGTPAAVTLENGVAVLDTSTLSFSAGAKAFSKPDIRFAMELDTLDVDKYMPPAKPSETGTAASEGTGATATGKGEADTAADTVSKKKPSAAGGIDYAPLRRLVLDGRVKVGKLQAGGMTVKNVMMTVAAKQGKITIKPFTVDLYQGKMNVAAVLNVQKKQPVGDLQLSTSAVQVGPLLKDALQKEFLEGALTADVTLGFAGDTPDTIKQNLNGKGELIFTDGAVVGVDLAGMVRNVKANLGMADAAGEKPRTDFAELKAPFTLKQGIFNTTGITMVSPLIRLLTLGSADLNRETLDFKVQPKFVATIKGQGDTKERSGLTVPVRVTGTFDAPKFRPDMEALLKTSVPQAEALKEEVKTLLEDKEGRKEAVKKIEDEAKNLLKSFKFGQ